MHRPVRFVAAALIVTAAAATAQNPPTGSLGRPDATFPEPITSPTGIRALDANRVIVADNIEGTLGIFDFRSGQITPIGRQGEGPGEFGMPGALYAARGDTTYMMDMGNRRLLVVTPSGISSATIQLQHPAGWPVIPRGVDAEGRIYFDLAGIQMASLNEVAASGRAPVLRWDPATNRTDTLTFVAFPPLPAVGPGETRITMGGGPYRPRDEWTVLPDGRVGVARAADYRVEWSGSGSSVAGPPVPYDPVRVGTAEKDAWADQMAARGVMVEVVNGQRRARRAPRPDISQVQWPDVMPPFSGFGAVRASLTGELWVLRSGPARESTRKYDVFDARGRLTARVTLEGDRFILGFGPGVAFVGYTDDDDLVWIERYPLPAPRRQT
jgi:hypothetical protein